MINEIGYAMEIFLPGLVIILIIGLLTDEIWGKRK